MNQCLEFKQMCAGSSDSLAISSFCSLDPSSRRTPPSMKMFFHFGFSEYVLFQDWIPRDGLEYYGTILVLILISILYEFLLAYYTVLEATWGLNIGVAVYPYAISGQARSGSIRIAATRFGFKFLSSTIGYALMLVTMTFNVGLYFAVVLGLAIGHVLFVGLAKRALFVRGVKGGECVSVGSCC
jgi:hypothetical protein